MAADKGQYHNSTALNTASIHSMVTIAHSNHIGRHASRNGTALAPKNGIMRCDTTANIVATNPHNPICVAVRSINSELIASDTAAVHNAMAPTPHANATTRAWIRSGTSLRRTIVENFTLRTVQPAATNDMPAQASRA